MRVALTYVYPLIGSEHYFNLAVRFLKTYYENPPGLDHDSIIVCNGNPPDEQAAFLFGSMPNAHFLHHDNSGLDCGAYQCAARNHECDLMVFFGASTYFKRAGWLKRMVEAYQQNGDGLYGTMGNRGVRPLGVHPHIRTTAFWTSRNLFLSYPHLISRADQRYGFEHGPDCLTSWMYKQRKRVMVVGWSGCYEQALWDSTPNGYHRGDQSDILAGDRMTCPPYHPCM